MTKQEIQAVMKIVRPAIIAIYGRKPLALSKYKDRLAYQGKVGKSLLLEVEGLAYNENTWEYEVLETYRVEVENGIVSSLSIGTVDI